MQTAIDAANQTISEKDNEIASLKEQLLASEKSESEEGITNGAIEELNKKNDELIAQNKTLDEAVQQLKAKEAVADAMINDLNNKASEAIHKLEEKHLQIIYLIRDNLQYLKNLWN